jgi:hypothetical protein
MENVVELKPRVGKSGVRSSLSKKRTCILYPLLPAPCSLRLFFVRFVVKKWKMLNWSRMMLLNLAVLTMRPTPCPLRLLFVISVVKDGRWQT